MNRPIETRTPPGAREAWYETNVAWLLDYFRRKGITAPEEILLPAPPLNETTERAIENRQRGRPLTRDEQVELTRWFLQCSGTVRRVLIRAGLPAREIDNAASEVFLRAVAEIGRYRRESNPRTWLAGIARLVALEYWGRSTNTRERPTETVDLVHDTPDAPSRLDGARADAALRAEFLRLPEDQRAVVWMYVYEELTMARIAAALGIPQATAWGRLRLAYERLTPAASVFEDQVRHERRA